MLMLHMVECHASPRHVYAALMARERVVDIIDVARATTSLATNTATTVTTASTMVQRHGMVTTHAAQCSHRVTSYHASLQ